MVKTPNSRPAKLEQPGGTELQVDIATDGQLAGAGSTRTRGEGRAAEGGDSARDRAGALEGLAARPGSQFQQAATESRHIERRTRRHLDSVAAGDVVVIRCRQRQGSRRDGGVAAVGVGGVGKRHRADTGLFQGLASTAREGNHPADRQGPAVRLDPRVGVQEDRPGQRVGAVAVDRPAPGIPGSADVDHLGDGDAGNVQRGATGHGGISDQ